MTYVEFKKVLIELDLSIPKFSNLLKISDKNINSYKKKEEIPNVIAVAAVSLKAMQDAGIEYKEIIESLGLELKKKKGAGFASKKTTTPETIEESIQLSIEEQNQ